MTPEKERELFRRLAVLYWICCGCLILLLVFVWTLILVIVGK